jgi:uncharacterized protein
MSTIATRLPGRVPVFFLITFAFTWFFWAIAVLDSAGWFELPVPAFAFAVIGAHGPLVASIVVVRGEGGWPAVRRLLRSGLDPRVAPGYFALMLAGPFVLAGIAFGLASPTTDFDPGMPLLDEPLLILPTLLFMFFLGGSVQEEFGWRGVALPRMLRAQSPLSASLILGVIWGIWHLPLFYIEGLSQSFMPLHVFLSMTLAFSVLFTWFFLRTNGSVFSALLLHAAINTSFNMFPPTDVDTRDASGLTWMAVIYLVAAVALVIRERTLFLKPLEEQARPESDE